MGVGTMLAIVVVAGALIFGLVTVIRSHVAKRGAAGGSDDGSSSNRDLLHPADSKAFGSKSSSYRDRRDKNLRRTLSKERRTSGDQSTTTTNDDDSDKPAVQKSGSSYRDRRKRDQKAADAGGGTGEGVSI